MAQPNELPGNLKATIASLETEISDLDNQYHVQMQNIEQEINRKTSVHERSSAACDLQLSELEEKKLQFLEKALEIGNRRFQRPDDCTSSHTGHNPAHEQDTLALMDAAFIHRVDQFREAENERRKVYEEKHCAHRALRTLSCERSTRIQQLDVEAKTTRHEMDSRLVQLKNQLKVQRTERRRTMQRLREELAALEKLAEQDEDTDVIHITVTTESRTDCGVSQKDSSPEPQLLDLGRHSHLDSTQTSAAGCGENQNLQEIILPAAQNISVPDSEQMLNEDTSTSVPKIPTGSPVESHPRSNSDDRMQINNVVSPSGAAKTTDPNNATPSNILMNTVTTKSSGMPAKATHLAAVNSVQQLQDLARSAIFNSKLSPLQLQDHGHPRDTAEGEPASSHKLFHEVNDTAGPGEIIPSFIATPGARNITPETTNLSESLQSTLPLSSTYPSLAITGEKPGPIHRTDAISMSPTVHHASTLTAESSGSMEYNSLPSSPLSPLDDFEVTSPSGISVSLFYDSTTPSSPSSKAADDIVFKIVNGVYTEPPLMKGVPVKKISEQDPYYEKHWHTAARYNSLEKSEARKGSDKLPFFDDPSCPIHPNQIVAKPFIDGHGLVDRNYSDAIRRILETLVRSGRTMEQAVQWLRHRLAQLHQERGNDFVLKSTLSKMRVQDDEYISILNAYPKDPPVSSTTQQRHKKPSTLKPKTPLNTVSSNNSEARQSPDAPTFPQLSTKPAKTHQEPLSQRGVANPISLVESASADNTKRKIPESFSDPTVAGKKQRLNIYDDIPEPSSEPFIRSRNQVEPQPVRSVELSNPGKNVSPTRNRENMLPVAQNTFEEGTQNSELHETTSQISPPEPSSLPPTVPEANASSENSLKGSRAQERFPTSNSAASDHHRPEKLSVESHESLGPNSDNQRDGTRPQEKRISYVHFHLMKMGPYGGQKNRYQMCLNLETNIFEPFQHKIPLSALNPELVIDSRMIMDLHFETLFKQGDSVVVEYKYHKKDKEHMKKRATTKLSFREVDDADRFVRWVMKLKPSIRIENDDDRKRVQQRGAGTGRTQKSSSNASR